MQYTAFYIVGIIGCRIDLKKINQFQQYEPIIKTILKKTLSFRNFNKNRGL